MKKYFVIGKPIDHSLSPKIHNYWIKQNKIEAIYYKKELDETDLKEFIAMIRDKKIEGANVTVPFKKKVIPFLDVLSKEADLTQSVNTICFDKGNLIGHNTDIIGFEQAIKATNFEIINKKIFILGAGGVVPSIIFALKKMNVSEIFVSNRTRKKAEDLKNYFNKINIVNWGDVPEFDVIINATSIGLKGEDKLHLDYSNLGKNKLFYDVIYNPSFTNFLKQGSNLGNKSENGKLMFIYQASAAFELWHGIKPKLNDEVFSLLSL